MLATGRHERAPERGSALVIAVLVIVILTLLGVSFSLTADTEIPIAVNGLRSGRPNRARTERRAKPNRRPRTRTSSTSCRAHRSGPRPNRAGRRPSREGGRGPGDLGI